MASAVGDPPLCLGSRLAPLFRFLGSFAFPAASSRFGSLPCSPLFSPLAWVLVGVCACVPLPTTAASETKRATVDGATVHVCARSPPLRRCKLAATSEMEFARQECGQSFHTLTHLWCFKGCNVATLIFSFPGMAYDLIGLRQALLESTEFPTLRTMLRSMTHRVLQIWPMCSETFILVQRDLHGVGGGGRPLLASSRRGRPSSI